MEIFIIRDGRQAGPFSEDAVRAFLTEGSVRVTDMGWRNGMGDWRPLGEVIEGGHSQGGGPSTPPPAQAANGADSAHVPATAKQKAFLKYLGAEFGENLTKERAALAVSDALETPKLQSRIRKWHDEKLRMHAEVFQDEIDFRKANRANRYLERIQTEGTEVVKDVTKAHVQVLVESLDKRHPGWESDRESALWDYLFPSFGEHFPQLVQPAYKGRLKAPGPAKTGSLVTRGIGSTSGIMMPPPAASGTFGAMLRGIVLGVLALGAIIAGHHFWQRSHEPAAVPAAAPAGAQEKKETAAAANGANAAPDPVPKEPAAPQSDKLTAEAKAPESAPENPPPPLTPLEPSAPAMNAEKSVAPALPAAPVAPEEKPAAPGMAPDAAPALTNTMPSAVPPVQRNSVKLIQGIGVMLPNGQVTLPAGTVLRYIAMEGPNIRVSWNNNVFFVPALATDVNEPLPAPSAPATPAAPPAPPIGAEPSAPTAPVAPKPKKPSDDL